MSTLHCPTCAVRIACAGLQAPAGALLSASAQAGPAALVAKFALAATIRQEPLIPEKPAALAPASAAYTYVSCTRCAGMLRNGPCLALRASIGILLATHVTLVLKEKVCALHTMRAVVDVVHK